MNLMNEHVLVTGAGGFIGSHLVEHLIQEGARVRAVVHYNSRNDWGNLEFLPKELQAAIEVQAIDIADPFSVREVVKDCACIFHLAALIGIPYSYAAPANYVDVNVRGTLNVLEAARLCRTPRVVHTSTSEAYGSAIYAPIDEAHPLQAQSPYSATKIAADKLAESYWSSFSLPVSTLRPFNTFGPRQSARAIIPTVISQLKRDGHVRVGNLAPVRDFTYVDDTARAFLAMAQADNAVGMVCNAGNGEAVSIGDLVKRLVEMIKPGAEIICEDTRVRPEQSEVMALIADASRLRSLTGWWPRVSLEEGLALVIDYVERNPEIYRHSHYVI